MTHNEENIDRKAAGVPSTDALIKHIRSLNGETTRAELARFFGLKGEARRALRMNLKSLEADGRISLSGGGRITIADSLPPIIPIDVMSVSDDGDLICMPASWRGDHDPPMIVLSAKRAAKVKPIPGVGDRLLARLSSAGDEGYRADVIRPIGKKAHRFLAVFEQRPFGGVGKPVERRARDEFIISKKDVGKAEDGDLVWLTPLSARQHGEKKARVTGIAGHIDDQHSISTIALAANDIPIEFSDRVLSQAEASTLPSLGKRDDLREIPLITIDPADARDHDDALFASPDTTDDNADGFKVIVAIADVSFFVRTDDAIDKEAQRRGVSVYLPDRVVPMLPEKLSNDLCSLRENEDRPCLAVELIINKYGEKIRHRFFRGMMRSAAKLSYEDAQEIENSKSGGDKIADVVGTLFDAFRCRMKEREKRAPLDLDLPERKIILKENGDVAKIIKRDRFDAHRVVEEFMILANVAAAEELEKKRRPLIYRIHEEPDEERLDVLRDYVESLGYSLTKSAVRPQQINHLLNAAEKRGEKEMISDVVLRAQKQAIYSTDNAGHFGLNLPKYAHFTSPIRRYADLTVHRALAAACGLGDDGQSEREISQLPKIAQLVSDYERRAIAAERETTDRYLARYLAKNIGAEFSGRIRGVTKFGLFVTLDETGADGFVPIRTLGKERFNFEESRHALIGARTGLSYRLGQNVDIRLAEATPLTGGMRFEMLTKPENQPGKSANGRKKTRPSPDKGKRKKSPKARRKPSNAKSRKPY